MHAYTPVHAFAWAGTILVIVTVSSIGFFLQRVGRRGAGARWLAWSLLLGATAAIERITATEPAGFRMLALCGGALFAMKAIVGVEAVARGGPRLRAWAWVCWSALWPGMRPEAFAAKRGDAHPDVRALVRSGLVQIGCGGALLAAAGVAWHRTSSLAGASLLALPGLSLVVHFGIFDLATAVWHACGVAVRKPFDLPLASASLGEFWGRRWNRPFTDMLQRAVHRPVSRRHGARAGLLASFVLSGLLHELAISVPVRAGIGLPSLYFVLHGALTLAERRAPALRTLVLRRGLGSRVWTLAALVLPAPLLFHPPFLRAIVLPLIGG